MRSSAVCFIISCIATLSIQQIWHSFILYTIKHKPPSWFLCCSGLNEDYVFFFLLCLSLKFTAALFFWLPRQFELLGFYLVLSSAWIFTLVWCHGETDLDGQMDGWMDGWMDGDQGDQCMVIGHAGGGGGWKGSGHRYTYLTFVILFALA